MNTPSPAPGHDRPTRESFESVFVEADGEEDVTLRPGPIPELFRSIHVHVEAEEDLTVRPRLIPGRVEAHGALDTINVCIEGEEDFTIRKMAGIAEKK